MIDHIVEQVEAKAAELEAERTAETAGTAPAPQAAE